MADRIASGPVCSSASTVNGSGFLRLTGAWTRIGFRFFANCPGGFGRQNCFKPGLFVGLIEKAITAVRPGFYGEISERKEVLGMEKETLELIQSILQEQNAQSRQLGILIGQNQEILNHVNRINGSIANLNQRIIPLETAQNKKTGASRVKSTIGQRCWRIIELIIAAVLGVYLGEWAEKLGLKPKNRP
jgi:hypothetical protein